MEAAGEPYNHYVEAKAIASDLENRGYTSEAILVREAIDRGVSGTEIFMRLRYYLTPFLHEVALTDATRARIALLVEKINSALSL